jgi:dTDP-4-dehydrorhamnose 3,5-epimerase
MKIIKTKIPAVRVIEPQIFEDKRGLFFESWTNNKFKKITRSSFIQDNHSVSKKGVLRGIHYQKHFPQGKLVRVVRGKVFDVAVDLKTGNWVGVYLSEENNKMLWIPRGFGHAFLALEDTILLYKCTNSYYNLVDSKCIRYDDPTINITWPKMEKLIISEKDLKGVSFK